MFPINIDRIHNVFHVLLLPKYIKDLSHLLRVEDTELIDDLNYKRLVQILDRLLKKLWNKQILLVKVF